jgi:hypothetical protein
MSKLRVYDAAQPDTPAVLDVEDSTTVEECRALVASLNLPSAAAALSGTHHLLLCFDGKILLEDSATLEETGVLAAPVLVAAAVPVVVADAAAAVPAAAAADAPAASSSAAAVPAAAPEDDGTPPPEAVCRICFSGAFENELGKLISPCRCIGTMRFVHVHCLNEWRGSSANPRSFYQCEQCLYKYELQRTDYAKWLESATVRGATRPLRPRSRRATGLAVRREGSGAADLPPPRQVVRAVAGAILLAALGVSCLLCGSLHVEQPFYRLVDFNPGSQWHAGRFVAVRWGARCDTLVAGVLGVAMIGLSLSVREAWHANRGVSQAWIIGLLAAFAQSGGRIMRVFAVIGLLHSCRAAVHLVEGVAKQLLTQWGTRILEVRRR